MKPLVARMKPVRGVSSFLHNGLLLVFPLALFALVRLDFVQLAYILIALSKWRMLAVRPRFWPANIRSNAVDIIVGVSTLVYMTQTSSSVWQLVWALVYAAWLIFLKPGSTVSYISVQAGVGFIMGLTAMFIAGAAAPLYALVLGAGILCFLAARHFFDSFDEPYSRLLSYLWGYFGAAMVWLLGHLLVVYPSQTGYLNQPLVLLVVIGSALAVTYYLDHFEKLSSYVKWQTAGVAAVIVLLILASLFYEGHHLLIR